MQGKLLLVDDDSIFRSELRSCLEEYDVIEASGGEEALKLFRRPNEIDLVILDIRMPGRDGIDVLGEIKKMSPNVSIIILTGYSSKETVIEALRGKADEYMEKPLDIGNTRKIIERLLEDKTGKTGCEESGIKGKIERVKAFIERNCFKKVRLEDAASAVSLSPKYLSRVFKEMTGNGFNKYKLALKVDKAKSLLKKSEFNVKQISDKLGYQNTESFIRQFKKITSRTPTEYRRKDKSYKKNKKIGKR